LSEAIRNYSQSSILYACGQGTELVFTPSLDFGVADGFYDIIDGLAGEIFKQSSKIRRIAKHSNQEHYQVFLRIINHHLNVQSVVNF
jgi:hypothetical protein